MEELRVRILTVVVLLGVGCIDLEMPKELRCASNCAQDAAGAEDAVEQRPDRFAAAMPDLAPDRLVSLDGLVSPDAPADAAPGPDEASPIRQDGAVLGESRPSPAPDAERDVGVVDGSGDAFDAAGDVPVPAPFIDAARDAPVDVSFVDVSFDGVDAVSSRPIGAGCALAGECGSGFCEDGVCCATACGLCNSCNQAGYAGTCRVVLAGGDSAGTCPRDEVAVCGRDGTCDGNGACRFYVSGTVCREATCAVSTFTMRHTCDGAGSCRLGTSSTCNGYVCASTLACKTTCLTNVDCVGPNVCVSNACIPPKATGQACVSDGDCASQNCEQGVCCGAACTGACYSCNLVGTVGSCAPVPSGQDPLEQCPTQAASSCGTTGSCDGSGGCAIHPVNSMCGAATCTNGRARVPSACNAVKMCVIPAEVWCVNSPCDPTTSACRVGCSGDGECVAPAKCVGGYCGGLKGDYFDGEDPSVAANFKFSRIDAQINFVWDEPNSPDQAQLGTGSFSVRWTGKVVPRFSETYTFYSGTDDGTRLWVNGVQLVNSWQAQPETEYSGQVALQADTAYDIVIEYYQGGGSARSRLSWSSNSEPKQYVPQNRMIPAP